MFLFPIAAVLLAASAALPPQQHEQQFFEGERPSYAQVMELLSSKQPRLVAWGATFARSSADDRIEEKLEALAEDWAGADSTSAGEQQREMMLAVLDAIISHSAHLPASSVAVLDADFPVQAAVLASRLPLSASTPLLSDWFANGMDGDRPTLEARVAGMLLVKEPPSGFAAALVRASEERLIVNVTSPTSTDTSDDRTFGHSSCGTFEAKGPLAGWPRIFTYYTGSYGQSGQVLAQLGPRRILYERSRLDQSHGYCLPPELPAQFRNSIAAALLDVRPRQMAQQYWTAERHLSIVVQSTADYTQQMQQLITREEQRMAAGVQALHDKHLLTDEEAAAVRPKLLVQVVDERGEDAGDLPDLPLTDERTTLTVVPPAHDQ